MNPASFGFLCFLIAFFGSFISIGLFFILKELEKLNHLLQQSQPDIDLEIKRLRIIAERGDWYGP